MNYLAKAEAIMAALSAQLGIPYALTRMAVPEAQLPDAYLVYFPVDDPGVSWADNTETAHEARVQVSLYYRKPAVMLTIPDAIETAFMTAGWTRAGIGTIPYQVATGHSGWFEDFNLYERR